MERCCAKRSARRAQRVGRGGTAQRRIRAVRQIPAHLRLSQLCDRPGRRFDRIVERRGATWNSAGPTAAIRSAIDRRGRSGRRLLSAACQRPAGRAASPVRRAFGLRVHRRDDDVGAADHAGPHRGMPGRRLCHPGPRVRAVGGQRRVRAVRAGVCDFARDAISGFSNLAGQFASRRAPSQRRAMDRPDHRPAVQLRAQPRRPASR